MEVVPTSLLFSFPDLLFKFCEVDVLALVEAISPELPLNELGALLELFDPVPGGCCRRVLHTIPNNNFIIKLKRVNTGHTGQ
jgi:hypothetical protein